MTLWFLGICLFLGSAAAASTTTPVAATSTVKTTLTTNPSSTIAVGSSTAKTETTPVTNSKSVHNVLLRKELSISPVTHRLRGRVVLANTRVEGSDEWGVSADQAEVACDRIARYQSQSQSPNFLLRTLLRRFVQIPTPAGSQPMEGHLLSVGSGYEVMALARLLNPLPKGAYWTGGRLTRYRVNNMRRPGYTDHVVLTWTDGRAGRPSVLGMTKLDEQQLREGYTYCLALNLREAAWQARDCSDQLPYACLVTPRQIGFSNQASEKKTTEESMEKTTESVTTEKTGGRATTEKSEMEASTTKKDNVMRSKMVTTPGSTPITTESTEMPEFTEESETTEGRRENLLADTMTTTPTTMFSKTTPTVMLDTQTTTESNLLEDSFTMTTKQNILEKGKEMFSKMIAPTTKSPGLPEVSPSEQSATEMSSMKTTKLPGFSEVLPMEQSSTKSSSMKTTNSFSGKSTTESHMTSTTATPKSTLMSSGSSSPAGMQTPPVTTAQIPINSRLPRNWEEDEDENNDEEE